MLSLIVLFAHDLAACDCKPVSTPDAIEQAKVVFAGQVVDINTNWVSGGWKISFAVEEVYKDRADRFIIINTPWEKDCGIIFKKEARYLVYAERPYHFKTHSCMGTKFLEEAEADLQLLGEGSAPSPSNAASSLNWLMGLMVLGGMLFIAFVVLRKKIFPHEDKR